jgi:peptidoglycan hydrolase FlgJ
MTPIILPAGVVPSSVSQPSSHARPPAPAVKPEVARAAREFEAIFLRQMLSSLEKTGHMGSTGSTGSDVYGSMMVGALADAVASAGGVGLAKYVTTSLVHPAPTPPAAPGATSLPGSTTAPGASTAPGSTTSAASLSPVATTSPAATAIGVGIPLQRPKPIPLQPLSKTSQKGIP